MYRRSGCHLCEQMAAELRVRGIAFDEIDVDSDPRLRLKYGADVPVLVFEDLVCKHRLTPEAIAKLR
ncbi:MAG TPA: glutaredoxin family protein [Burkholderiales bacterium]|nr:glutaredoxin family protein [Burkholderiales bacterium]